MQAHPYQSEWISISETAVRLSCSDKTVRRMVARGELEARKFGKRMVRINAASIAGVPIGGVAA